MGKLLILLCLIHLGAFEDLVDKDATSNWNNSDSDVRRFDVSSVSRLIRGIQEQIKKESEGAPKISDGLVNFLFLVYEQENSESSVVAPAPPSTNPTPATSPANETSEEQSTTLVNCRLRDSGNPTVEVVNSTRLVALLTVDANVTTRATPAECLVLLFYSRFCPFSCLAAPHFNALPRAFPQIKMAAINVQVYQGFNTQFGIAGVPTVILFHNGRPASKFNFSEYTLEIFAKFITRYTGVKPVERMFVSSADFGGPVPSILAQETDYLLILAWAVVLVAAGVAVSKSSGWRSLVETLQASWREAQAQHDHTD